MNKARRKWLQDTIEAIENAKIELESIRDEEQECFDNLPESIQYGERGDAMQENIDEIDGEISNLEDVISNLNDIVER